MEKNCVKVISKEEFVQFKFCFLAKIGESKLSEFINFKISREEYNNLNGRFSRNKAQYIVKNYKNIIKSTLSHE